MKCKKEHATITKYLNKTFKLIGVFLYLQSDSKYRKDVANEK